MYTLTIILSLHKSCRRCTSVFGVLVITISRTLAIMEAARAISDLPPEVLTEIFKCLHIPDLKNVRLTSRYWNSIKWNFFKANPPVLSPGSIEILKTSNIAYDSLMVKDFDCSDPDLDITCSKKQSFYNEIVKSLKFVATNSLRHPKVYQNNAERLMRFNPHIMELHFGEGYFERVKKLNHMPIWNLKKLQILKLNLNEEQELEILPQLYFLQSVPLREIRIWTSGKHGSLSYPEKCYDFVSFFLQSIQSLTIQHQPTGLIHFQRMTPAQLPTEKWKLNCLDLTIHDNEGITSRHCRGITLLHNQNHLIILQIKCKEVVPDNYIAEAISRNENLQTIEIDVPYGKTMPKTLLALNKTRNIKHLSLRGVKSTGYTELPLSLKTLTLLGFFVDNGFALNSITHLAEITFGDYSGSNPLNDSFLDKLLSLGQLKIASIYIEKYNAELAKTLELRSINHKVEERHEYEKLDSQSFLLLFLK